jgi:hypothetical protein
MHWRIWNAVEYQTSAVKQRRGDVQGSDMVNKEPAIARAPSRLDADARQFFAEELQLDPQLKLEFLDRIGELARNLDCGDAPDASEVRAAFVGRNLPTHRSISGLLGFVSDPATLRFSGNYDHNIFNRNVFEDLTAGYRTGGASVATLLAAGLLKFMGRYGAAQQVYRSIGGSFGMIGEADILASAALLDRHLAATEQSSSSVLGLGDRHALLAKTLHWPKMPTPSLQDARLLAQDASKRAPTLPIMSYFLAVICMACDAHEDASASLEKAYRLVPAHKKATRAGLRLLLERAAYRLSGKSDALAQIVFKGPVKPSQTVVARETECFREIGFEDLGRPFIGTAPREELSFSYVVHDEHKSRFVQRRTTSRPLYAVQAENARPLAPANQPIAIGENLLLETRMFTGHEREVWDPWFYCSSQQTAVYHFPKGDTKIVDTPVVLLSGLGSFYYHFLFDVVGALSIVPRAQLVNRAVVFSEAPALGALREWQDEILSMLPLPTGIVYEGRGRTIYRDAIVCSYPSQDNAVAPSAVRFLREQLYLTQAEADPRNRIFFTRTGDRALKDDKRQLVNRIAERYGFRCLDPLKLSVRQQRDILSRCGIFMCEAGSGLANMIFLPKDAKVITLGANLVFKDYFCPVAAILEQEMHVVLSDVESMFPTHQFLWSTFFPDLNIQALERCLAAVTSTRRLDVMRSEAAAAS